MAKHIYATLPDYPKSIGKKKKKPKTVALVFEGNCTGCEVCVPFCPVDCIESQPRSAFSDRPIPPVQIRFDECIGCQICVKACNKLTWDAIRMVPADQIEKEFNIKLSDTYEEALENKTQDKIDPKNAREISNSKFLDYWRE
ncbi:MAG: 4Fe-4S dicluster domain-containing protein [Bdellovibrionales bacterium]|nr:4Fe-4S dicluster domain-containing protein [Bdellovibrionales bacterium]